jgi:ferredoxin
VFEITQSKLKVREEYCIYCRGCEVFCPQKAIKLLPLIQTLKFKEVRTLSN